MSTENQTMNTKKISENWRKFWKSNEKIFHKPHLLLIIKQFQMQRWNAPSEMGYVDISHSSDRNLMKISIENRW